MGMKRLPGGLLVAIEGIDGAGKTTVARALESWLVGVGALVLASKEPTRGPWGMKMRESAASGRLSPADERRFLLLDRKQHVEEVIAPALRQGGIVILDRYFPSMLAYQGAAGLDVGDLLIDNDFAPRPDVLLLLDLPPDTGIERIRARGDEPNHFESPESLALARGIFLSLPLDRRVIDASQPIDHVVADAQLAVLAAITDKLRTGRERDPGVALEISDYMPRLAL